VFVGIYDDDGWAICEQFHDRRVGEHYCTALKWGARAYLSGCLGGYNTEERRSVSIVSMRSS
jgi:hypothetical protein